MLLCASSERHSRNGPSSPPSKEAVAGRRSVILLSALSDCPNFNDLAGATGMPIAAEASHEPHFQKSVALDGRWPWQSGGDCDSGPGAHGLEPVQTSHRACCGCSVRAHGDDRRRSKRSYLVLDTYGDVEQADPWKPALGSQPAHGEDRAARDPGQTPAFVEGRSDFAAGSAAEAGCVLAPGQVGAGKLDV